MSSNEGQRDDTASIAGPVKTRRSEWASGAEMGVGRGPGTLLDGSHKGRGQALATSCLHIGHYVHGMKYSCWPDWVSSPVSAPPWCYLVPADGQLERPSSHWQLPRY